MKEKVKILFFCMIFVGKAGFSQQTGITAKPGNHSFVVNNQLDTLHFYNIQLTKSAKKYFIEFLKKTPQLPKKTTFSASIPIISNNFYTQNFGFFCKRELQLEKAIKIPFKFRLGSVQQCDWMEGKVNAIKSF